MIKTHIPDEHEALANAGPLFTLFDNTRSYTKQASASSVYKKLAHTLTPPDSHYAVHLVAMGDGEYFGENKNCFPAGTPVRTPSGFKNIEDMQVGDLVLTHKGRYRKVLRLYVSETSKPLVRIQASNLPEAIFTTDEHPVEVVRAAHTSIETLHKKIKGKRPGIKEAATRFSDAVVRFKEFVPAASLQEGDWLFIPNDSDPSYASRILDVDPWILGLYLAEGCISREYRKELSTCGKPKMAVFSLGEHDDEAVIPYLQSYIADQGYSAKLRETPNTENGRRIEFRSSGFAELVADLFGVEARSKTIHAVVLAQPKQWKLKFAAGWFDGDGCIAKTGKGENTLTGSSASLDLVCSMQRLLASCGIPSSIAESSNKPENGCFGKSECTIYQLIVGAGFSSRITQYTKRLKPTTRTCRAYAKARVTEDGLYVQVTSVTQEPLCQTTVYNLEVDDDHTYVTLFSVHNCDYWPAYWNEKRAHTFVDCGCYYREHKNTDPRKYGIGEVKAAAYNPDMHRIELVVWGDKRKSEEEYEEIRKDKPLSFSMSARVKGDICN